MSNKGKPSKSNDQRKEPSKQQQNSSQPARTTERTDTSQKQKGGKAPSSDIGGVQRPPADS